jgi:predicted GIY-YIG superfamily endonuclease
MASLRVTTAIASSGSAIAREKELKGWKRAKKITLIEWMNLG